MSPKGFGKTTRRGALGLIAAGAATAIGSTGAFSNATANRAATVSTVTDPNGLLGVEGVTDTSTTPTYTNNTSEAMTVTLTSPDSVEFDVGDNGTWVAPPVSFSLAAGASMKANIRFAGQCTAAGTATVNISAVHDDGDLSIDMTRDFEIPEAGQVQLSGTVSSSGSSGKYEFTIENTGCADVTFTGIGIRETTSDADYVSGGGSLYNVDTSTELVTDRIPVDSTDPTSDTKKTMSPTVDLVQNDTVTFEFNKFQRSGPGKPNVDMRGEDVRTTFYLSDGSDATIKLCSGTCDF